MSAQPRIPGLFITGTDTNVGKTFVAALMAKEFTRAGLRVGVYKPVASGCRLDNGTIISDDAITLWEAAGRPETLEAVCPQRFLAPLAPNVAAADEGRVVDETLLSTGFDFWRERSDVLLVEGAGGLLSPVSEGLLNADLAAMFGLPLVIVAANRLGVINHTLLTIQVAEQHRGKLKILGIFLNQMPGNSDTSQQSNFIQIANRVSCKNITMIGPHHKFGISTVAMHLLDLSREISND